MSRGIPHGKCGKGTSPAASAKRTRRAEALTPKLPPASTGPQGGPTLTPGVTNFAHDAAVKDTVLDSQRAPEAPAQVIDDFTAQALVREHDLLERTLLEEQRELSLADFWFFFTQVLFPVIWAKHYLESFHKPIIDRLQGLLRRPTTNLLLVIPREHRKSMMMFGYMVWLILRDPDIRIQLIGAKEKTVGKWVTLVRDAFLEGSNSFKHLHAVFPEFVIPKRARTLLQAFAFTHPLRTKPLADPTLFGTYLGVTGAGSRADVQIFDDPYERRNVSNPMQSLKALQQTLDLFPLVEKAEGAPYRLRIFCVTRWAYHDPTSFFLGEKTESGADAAPPPFEAIVRHAFEKPGTICTVCPKRVVEMSPHGQPDLGGEPILYPILTREALMNSHAEYMADPDRGESLWYHQYQNVCLAPSDRKFQPEWVVRGLIPVFPAPLLRVLAIDSADKDFQQAGVGDWMVALAGEFDDYARLLLVHGMRNRMWTRGEFIRRILTWCKQVNWWPSVVAKEKFGDDTFLTDIGQAFLNENRPCHLVVAHRPVQSTGQSYMRKLDWIVHSLQGPMERAEIICGSACPGDIVDRLAYELSNLGQVKNDDLADCLSIFFAPGVRPTGARLPQTLVVQPRPPALDLYGAAPTEQPAPSLTPLEQALQSGRIPWDLLPTRKDMSQVNRQPAAPVMPQIVPDA